MLPTAENDSCVCGPYSWHILSVIVMPLCCVGDRVEWCAPLTGFDAGQTQGGELQAMYTLTANGLRSSCHQGEYL